MISSAGHVERSRDICFAVMSSVVETSAHRSNCILTDLSTTLEMTISGALERLRLLSLKILFLDVLEVAVGVDFQFSGSELVADDDAVRMSLEG